MHEGPVLLTGATGYIGSRLLRELEAGGYTVLPSRSVRRRRSTLIASSLPFLVGAR